MKVTLSQNELVMTTFALMSLIIELTAQAAPKKSERAVEYQKFLDRLIKLKWR